MVNMDLLIAKTLKANQNQDAAKVMYPAEVARESTANDYVIPGAEKGIPTPAPVKKPDAGIPGLSPNIQIVNISTPTYSGTTMKLARDMTRHNELLQNFIAELRRAIQNTDKRFHMDLSQYSEDDRRAIVDIAYRMIGLITVNYRKETLSLQGRVNSEVPEAKRFLMGGYLEIGLCEYARKIASDYADAHRIKADVDANVTVSDGFAQNELDILIRVGNTAIVCEVKSGMSPMSVDFEKYYLLGQRLGIIPDRFILVSSGITQEQADQIHDFLNYHACTLHNFEQVLLRVLNTYCGGMNHVA